MAELLKSKSCSINAQGGTTDETPLHKCIRHGTIECLKRLIANRPPPNTNIKDALGETTLHRAADHPNIFVWKHLLELGGDVTITNDHGYSVIQKVLRANNTVALSVMREHGTYAF